MSIVKIGTKRKFDEFEDINMLANLAVKFQNKCVHMKCNKTASFGYPIKDAQKKEALYCAKHKLEGMTDVIHKKCLYEGCNKCPSYNYPISTISFKSVRLYCKKHKLNGMVRVIGKYI